MTLSYEHMVVVTCSHQFIDCGWLDKYHLTSLLGSYWEKLDAPNITTLVSLGILHLGEREPGQMVAAALMRCHGVMHDLS